MVDINLIGEAENREERQPEDSFAQTVNLDLGETADDEQASPFVTEPAPSYSREAMAAGSGYATRPLSRNANTNAGSSRKMAYWLAAVMVLAAVGAILLMFWKTGKQESELANRPELPIDSSMVTPAPVDSTQPPIKVEPSPPENFDPLFASTRIGASTVGALARSFGGDNDFSLISYAGNNNSFMVQFTSPSNEAIAEVTQAVQRNAAPQELRTVSNLPAGNGSAMNNVMIIGRVGELTSSRVSERAAMMGAGGQRRMSFTEISAWLKKLGADNGLSATLFDAGQPYSGDGGARTPVQANFSGAKAGAFDFLNSLAEAGPNISISKIILSSADRRTPSSAKLDVVLLFDFIE